MSVYLFESGGNISDTEIITEEFDELMLAGEHMSGASIEKPAKLDDGYRHINFILDHSAFVRGIGNIKRWFSEEYIRASYNHVSNEKIKLIIHIPTYTLHEFDFVKKGNTMMATNAREAIKFIDKFVNDEGSSIKNIDGIEFHCSMEIEIPYEERETSWNECLQHKIYSPLIKEFPNFKTKFDSNLLGKNSSSIVDESTSKLNNIQYENSESYQNALAHGDSQATMPDRLKYLIKSCVRKRKEMSRTSNEQWRLVTEDPITKVWAISFGIECLNINEAELLIFQDYDINIEKKNVDPHFQYTDGKVNEGPNSILQNTIDTTVYLYTSTQSSRKTQHGGIKSKKDQGNVKLKKEQSSKKQKNKLPPKVEIIEGVINEGTGIHGGIVKKERFDAINYAPRGSGQLWKP